jgi:hypothetical protein
MRLGIETSAIFPSPTTGGEAGSSFEVGEMMRWRVESTIISCVGMVRHGWRGNTKVSSDPSTYDIPKVTYLL